jgi:hypothetical protein
MRLYDVDDLETELSEVLATIVVALAIFVSLFNGEILLAIGLIILAKLIIYVLIKIIMVIAFTIIFIITSPALINEWLKKRK